ncbi:MAG TPA: acyl-CoA thioesterase [Gammaproteobacteria bacterium]|nr:acyl-CoA thioesterase [Gammaproteobacteria bacterium]
MSEPRGQLVTRVVAMPADTNVNGDVFGGWLVSNMDLAGGIEGRRRAKCRVVTVAIDSMRFIKPIKVGDTVGCYVDTLKIGRTSIQFKIEAWALSFIAAEHQQVAEGLFTFVAIDDDGRPQPVDR